MTEEGVVTSFDRAKGSGAILRADGTEAFVHVSGVTGTIKEGDRVAFEIQNGRKGPNAVNVKVIG